MFKIGDFSRLTQVSIRMLRYYDELGLFKPAQVDPFTGYRFYAATQIPQLNKIVALRDMGFLVAEIAEVLSDPLDNQKFLSRLTEKRQLIMETITNENQKLQRLDRMINTMGMEGVYMNYEVVLKAIPACYVVSKREIIPAYNQEGLLWEKLGRFIEKHQIPCKDPGFALYHDQDYKENDVDVEVAMCVDKLLSDQEGFSFREVEGVPHMAALMVSGPFENIAPAFNALAEWVENNGYEVAGITRQICHKGPWNENNPENYLTEIQIPVRSLTGLTSK